MSPIGAGGEVLIVAPRERGGVCQAVAAVVDRLPAAWIGTAPVDRALLGIATSRARVVHLHPSLRARAVARDTVLHTVARGRGAATVVHWHGWDRGLAERIDRSRVLRTSFCSGLGAADVIAVVAPEQEQRWSAWGRRTTLVPNAYDPERVPTEREPTERPVLLFVGRRTRAKGVPLLLDAFASANVDATLVIAGDGPVDVGGDGVVATGWLDGPGIRTWLARAHALVSPSMDEAAPIAVIEALAAGVPVIAARTGAIPAMVGAAGILLDRMDRDALVDAIRAVLASPPPTDAARVRAEHHPDVVARRWMELYAEAGA